MVIRSAIARGRVLFFMATVGVILSGCAQTTWQDATGNGRGAADMQMASANCQLNAQSSAPQTDTSQCQQGDKGCVIGGLLGNVLSQVGTYNLCMQSQGWQQVQVQVAVQQVSPEQVQVAENDDDDADDDSDDSDTMADAKDALDQQDFTTALELYREAADDGNAEAENNVGLFYVNG